MPTLTDSYGIEFNNEIPILVQTDSYKIGHKWMMPEHMDYMFDYMEARKGGKHPKSVFFNLQTFIQDVLLKPFTQNDIIKADMFYNMHFPPVYKDMIFDRDMFQYILDTYDGYFPIKIKAVPEGTIIPEGNVLCTFECKDPKCPTVVSFLEAKATSYIWYGTTVATNSFSMKEIILKYARKTSDSLDWTMLNLFDFGARGVAPGAQGHGGSAHLIFSEGSDNVEAVYKANVAYGMKKGLPGYGIPATEHSVMGAEGRDGEMIVAQRVFDRYAKKDGIVAMVNDTYDMEKHIKDFSKIFKEKYMETGVRWVTRPDSGYPPEVVLRCLDILWKEFGGTINSKGYRLLHPQVRVIQGDGIDIEMLEKVLITVEEFEYSTENVNFGSGGGLLQKVNRDDLRFSMKASYIEVNGVGRDVYKQPKTQTGDYNKESKKGKLSLYQLGNGQYVTLNENMSQYLFSIGQEEYPIKEVLKTVYDATEPKSVKTLFYTFDEVRENASRNDQ